MFDLSFTKLLVIGFIALLLVGPARLPHYAAQLAKFVRVARSMVDSAKVRVREEMGPDYDDVDWAKLDPRQYDPRRIIRDALLEPPVARATQHERGLSTVEPEDFDESSRGEPLRFGGLIDETQEAKAPPAAA